MTEALSDALARLTEIQRQAVEWDTGAALVLAGPGSGKTQVLTCRIARVLDRSRGRNFRVLALTFTNKAADEMKSRVTAFVPGLEERANIGTFHSFCGQVLRQHGVHLGIKPDFTIYSQDNDRRAVLKDALARASATIGNVSCDDVRFLPLIDRMKSRLIELDQAEKTLANYPAKDRVVQVYRYYEEELRQLNALDFNSLILETYRLARRFPALANSYTKSHPYWLLDEFQDTNSAQYKLIRAFAGSAFKNIFAVADDDQIIYQWNGASYRHIVAFRTDFAAEVIQLPTNYRCPPAIVEAANKLVAYNAERSSEKQPLLAGKTNLKFPTTEHIKARKYTDEHQEAFGVAAEIARLGKANWGHTAVIARTRSLLERTHKALDEQCVPAVLVQRRDDFLSSELRWFVACLTQLVRPLDKRNLAVLINSYNSMARLDVSVEQVLAEAEASGHVYIRAWLDIVENTADELLPLLRAALDGGPNVKSFQDHVPIIFETRAGDADRASDLLEDLGAWRELNAEIWRQIGRNSPLEQFLQELQLRSKEPSPRADTVTLTTIHGAKGREFDFVFIVGLAEDVMPSFQSKERGDASPEMEEERRNCFVAITRTRECLVLSRAEMYRGWRKAPSRFLVEMGLGA